MSQSGLGRIETLKATIIDHRRTGATVFGDPVLARRLAGTSTGALFKLLQLDPDRSQAMIVDAFDGVQPFGAHPVGGELVR